MDEQLLGLVSQYLFPDEQPGQDLFKSLYSVKPHGSYTGKAKELLDLTIDSVPKWAYQNTAFSYSMSTKLKHQFIQYIEEEIEQQKAKEEGRKPNPDNKSKRSPEDALKQALEQTHNKMGVEQDSPDGQKHQDELLGDIEEQGEEQQWGIMATKQDAHAISEVIKRVDASFSSVQKSLKNVSAVSDALLKGIEKVKSDFSEFGIGYGRNLQQLDPSELALLHGKGRDLFMLKYVKGELLEESSEDKKGLGDLIIAVDTSGSTCTSAAGGMNVLDLEMGIAHTIAKIASKHKCKVRLCMHTTRIHSDSTWIQGKDAINEYFADVYVKNKCVASGDNDFDEILDGLCSWMEERDYPSKRKPGIIFITDGHDTVDQSTLDRVTDLKQRQGIKLYSYFVAVRDPRDHAAELISVSEKSYWIDANKKIETQIDSFLEISK